MSLQYLGESEERTKYKWQAQCSVILNGYLSNEEFIDVNIPPCHHPKTLDIDLYIVVLEVYNRCTNANLSGRENHQGPATGLDSRLTATKHMTTNCDILK